MSNLFRKTENEKKEKKEDRYIIPKLDRFAKSTNKV
jgi:hypothetical protein